MTSFKFSHIELGTTDETRPLTKQTDANALKYVTNFQLKDEDRFSHMGGCPVSFRASIVRLAFMKLLGTGLINAIVAATASPKVAYSCGLCFAVNTVACIHYSFIWAWRGQLVPKQLEAFVSKVGLGKEDDGNDGRRLLVSELSIHSLRYSDWLVTLPLLCLDSWSLAEHANPDGTAILNKYWCTALQPVIIMLASIPRFVLGQCRYNSEKPGAPQSVEMWAWLVGGLCWIGAAAVFGICLYSILEFIWDNGTPPDEFMRRQDAIVITALSYVQIGYAVVSLYSYAYLHLICGHWRAKGGSFPAHLSCQLDVAYAALDVTTKGGLAIYVATRAAYI